MEHRAEIERAASHHRIDPDLVEAIVTIESGGDPFAWNPEPAYRYYVDCRNGKPFRKVTPAEISAEYPPADFPCLAGDRDQEWWGQQASWGLMQVMGAVARELGYRKPYLTELVDVRLNLFFGCLLLARLLTYFKGNQAKALEAYNGGIGSVGSERTQAYSRKVLDRLEALRKAGV
jgi:soluble lytic murein transglycosylase-like protein